MTDKIIRFISLFFFMVAGWLIIKEVRLVGAENLFHLIWETPQWVILGMLVVTGSDYLILSGYDVLALQYIEKKLPYKKILEAAGISFAVSNTAGHVYASGGTIRYLFYIPMGLNKMDILKIIVFETLTVFMGLATAYLIAVLLAPFDTTLYQYKHINDLYAGAVSVLLIFTLYYAAFVAGNRPIKIGKLSMPTITKEITVKQILLGLSDNILLFLTFYIGLRYKLPAPFFETFVVFVIAQVIGMLTQVPGGIGVFESAFLYLFPHTLEQKGAILSSLIIFRMLYYFLPFIIACLYLGIKRYKRKLKSPSST